MEEVSHQKLLLSWFQPGASSTWLVPPEPFSPSIYNLHTAPSPLDSERCEARFVAFHLYTDFHVQFTQWEYLPLCGFGARQITVIMQGARRAGILLWDSRTVIFRLVLYVHSIFTEWQYCLEYQKRCHSARDIFSSFMASKLLLITKWMDYQ